MATILDYQHMDSVDVCKYFKEVLVGHKIVGYHSGFDRDTLITDNGYEITIEQNAGCGGCSNGWSLFQVNEDLVDCENGIIDVTIDDREDNDCDELYRISIFKVDNRLTVIDTDDGYGNGYYGGGFYVTVKSIGKA